MENFRSFETQNQEATENREKRADVLLRFVETSENIEPFHGQKLETIFSDEEHRREFIKNLNTEEFTQLLEGLNGILRNKNKEDWKMDGQDVGVGGNIFTGLEYISPRQEDKPELLDKLLSAVKKMNEEGKDLKDIALAVSATINAIHPFLDGNGRTSRFVYSILTEGFNKEQIKKILSKSATFDGTEINIDPGLIKTKIDDMVEADLGVANPEINKDKILGMRMGGDELKFTEEIDEKQKELFINLYSTDRDYLLWGIFKFLQDNPNIDKEQYLKQIEGGSVVLASFLTRNLDQEKLNQILLNYRDLKKKYVEKIIGSIADPDKEEYQIEIDGQKIPLKNYFENRIEAEREKRAEEDRIEKEREMAEQQEKERIEQKERLIKGRFNNGEGNYKFFEPSEIKSIQEVERELTGITQIEQQEISEEQKIDILKKTLFALAGKINSNVSISQEQIDSYVENKKTELAEFFAQFQKVSDMVNFIENSGTFEYKIHTSSDYEIPYAEQEYLDRQEDITRFLDELFSQSIYYVSPSGSALRLKLFEIKSKELAGVIQPTTEQIFYNDKMVDYTDKKVIQVSGIVPEQGKFVFEITTPGFRQKVLTQENLEQTTKSGVGTISDEERIYINIPEGATLHSGWRVVGVKKLKG